MHESDSSVEMEYILHPKSEIDARIKRLQSLMGDLAGVMLFEFIDLGYFSGTSQDGLIYIPRYDQPIVMVRKSFERAREESPLDVQLLKSFKSLKKDLGLPDRACIGLEMDVLPCNNYARLRRALGEDASFIDISGKIKQVRSVKSDFEIKLIREAARMVDIGISSIQDHLREGIREIELASIVESTMKVMGHQGNVVFRRFNHKGMPVGHLMSGENAAIPSFVASPTGGKGLSLFFPQGPGFRKIKRGEPVSADFAGCYNGYLADETRIFCLGKLPAMLEDAHLAALQIENVIAEELRSGRTGREIFELSEGLGSKLGYQDFLEGPVGRKAGFVGHGVGLEIDEYPVIGPVDHKILENMTIAIEPKMIFPGIGMVGIEDTFLTGLGKAERLTRLSQEIWQV
jgi:Xaa-Pro dipeptidase